MKKAVIVPFLLILMLIASLSLLTITYTRMHTAEQTLHRLYESGLSECCERLQALRHSLDKVQLMTDTAAQAQMLGAVGTEAAIVQEQLGFLPLSQPVMLSASETTRQVAQHAQDMLPSLSEGQALTYEQLTRLKHDGAECTLLAGQLAILEQDEHWRSLRTLASTDMYDAPVMRVDAPLGLSGAVVTADEALTIAAQIIGEGHVRRVSAASGTSGVLPAHGVMVETPDLQLNLEITQQGGQLLWMMPETASFTPRVDADTCRAAAEAFMRRLGYPQMTLTAWQLYDGLYVAAYVPTLDGVLLYPDLVHVQVRMDTGDVVGFEAAQYWTHHAPRALPQPALTSEDAAALIAPHAKVFDTQLCVITHERAETLCHQVHAISDNEDYYVYIDAVTGQTIAVQKLLIDENGILPA